MRTMKPEIVRLLRTTTLTYRAIAVRTGAAEQTVKALCSTLSMLKHTARSPGRVDDDDLKLLTMLAGGPRLQAELAKDTKVHVAALNNVLRRLESYGYVERTPGAVWGNRLVDLTPAGALRALQEAACEGKTS